MISLVPHFQGGFRVGNEKVQHRSSPHSNGVLGQERVSEKCRWDVVELKYVQSQKLSILSFFVCFRGKGGSWTRLGGRNTTL